MQEVIRRRRSVREFLHKDVIMNLINKEFAFMY